MADREFLDAGIAELAPRIAAREISPVALAEAALARIEATEPVLKAYALLTPDLALAAARKAADEIAAGRYRGPLHGIPVAVKDLYDMAGLPTTCSSEVRHDHVAAANSACVQRLKAAGAVIVGKTHTHEFAYGIVTPTSANPWNPERIPGGSSGGSGASVAARGCFMGLGSDTGGSIRIPAALCGTVGLKPTYGRVSRAGVTSLCWSLDHVGPLTRTVRDAALALECLAGYDPRDPGSADEPVGDYTGGLEAGVRGLRIGVPRELLLRARRRGGRDERPGRARRAGRGRRQAGRGRDPVWPSRSWRSSSASACPRPAPITARCCARAPIATRRTCAPSSRRASWCRRTDYITASACARRSSRPGRRCSPASTS